MNALGASVASILAHVGEYVQQLEFSGCGSSCRVWKVQSERRCYALRIVDQERRVLDADIDSFVRTTILARGGRVAETVLNSEELGRLPDGRPWNLDAFVPGAHPRRVLSLKLSVDNLGKHLPRYTVYL